MSASAQALPARPRREFGLAWLAPLLAVALAGQLLAPGAAHALAPQRWALQDQDARAWSLTLLGQGDPAHPPGLRLRLTDRSATQQLDHSRPLRLHDSLGGEWELENCSGELVPADDDTLPAGSAQFALTGLQPSPRAELPLALEVPLASGASALLVADPAAVAALQAETQAPPWGRR